MDLDGDGRLDLWFKNRTGPQLRFLHNRPRGRAHWVTLVLEGRGSNRDAVGADVRVHHAGGVASRFVAAGDGYLSQSSRRLHFGLGDRSSIERVEVRWPGGSTERFRGVEADGLYRLVQGTGQADPVSSRPVTFDGVGALPPAEPGPTRVLLKTPLPLPPTLTGSFATEMGSGRARLINLWAEWCAPCRDELVALAAARPAVRAAGLDVLALGVDTREDAGAARAFFAERVAARLAEDDRGFAHVPADDDVRAALEEILRHVLVRHEELVLPTSLLVDPQGRLQVVYLGATSPARVLDDLERYVTNPAPGARRSLYGGRWYFRSPRDLAGLAGALRQRGLDEDARYYLAVERLRDASSP